MGGEDLRAGGLQLGGDGVLQKYADLRPPQRLLVQRTRLTQEHRWSSGVRLHRQDLDVTTQEEGTEKHRTVRSYVTTESLTFSYSEIKVYLKMLQ